jgi:hypothetical protein
MIAQRVRPACGRLQENRSDHSVIVGFAAIFRPATQERRIALALAFAMGPPVAAPAL